MPNSRQGKTWKSLKTSSQKKPTSWRARLRKALRIAKFTFFIIFLGTIIYGGIWLYKSGYIQTMLSPVAEDLKKVEYKTDGCISQKWLVQNGYFPPQKNLAEIDVNKVKERLENISQVRSAEVLKIYPDTIRIILKEYAPAARIAVIQEENFREYILSKDGFFFNPVCIPASEIEQMPHLAGVPLVSSPDRIFEPYAYAPKVFELINLAKKNLPEHFKTWKVINVSELGSITLPIMLVLNSDGVRIIFHSNDIPSQLDKLEYILNYYKNDGLTMIEKIDLSISSKAVVTIRPSKNE